MQKTCNFGRWQFKHAKNTQLQHATLGKAGGSTPNISKIEKTQQKLHVFACFLHVFSRKRCERVLWKNVFIVDHWRKAAEKSCWEELLRERLPFQNAALLSKSLLFFRRVGLVDSTGRQPSRHFVLVGRSKLVKCKFFRWPRQPSRHFVLVGRSKLWWNATFLDGRDNPLVTSCLSDAQNCG